MPVFCLHDIRWVISALGTSSQMRTRGEATPEHWDDRFNLAKFVILNMSDALIGAMKGVDHSFEWPEAEGIPLGPNDSLDENGNLHVDGRSFTYSGIVTIMQWTDTPILFPDEMPEGLVQQIDIASAIRLVLESRGYEDGFYCLGKLLCATWHIMDVIDVVSDRCVRLPIPDSKIENFSIGEDVDLFGIPHPSNDEISAFLERFDRIEGYLTSLKGTGSTIQVEVEIASYS